MTINDTSMKKIIFEVSDDMFRKIDDVMVKEGFLSRAEFLRFLIISYCKENGLASRNMTDRNANDKKDIDAAEEDEFANVDCEYGIPPEVVQKIWDEVKAKGLK